MQGKRRNKMKRDKMGMVAQNEYSAKEANLVFFNNLQSVICNL